MSAELDRYLEDEVLPDDVDVLGFWKNNFQYPTLREIAKDLLAIPVSSVASESAFSTGGRVLTPHRSRLHSNTVEALMCLQNWMIGGCPGTFKHMQFSFNELESETRSILNRICLLLLSLTFCYVLIYATFRFTYTTFFCLCECA